MKKGVLLLFVLVICSAMFVSDAFPFNLGGKNVERIGTGYRSMFLIGSVYSASLYVPDELKGKSAKEIIEADEPTAVIMTITSKLITREKFVKAVREGFGKSARSGYSTDKSDAFLNLFSTVEIARGDVIYLQYAPKTGLSASLKSKETGQTKSMGTTPGLAFKKALFAIWLGSNPVQESLKKGMLGQK